MRRERRTQINSLAERIRATLDLSVPVDVEKAVERLNGEVATENLLDFEAKIEKVDEGFRITLSTEFPSARRKFSIAHELGHLFLHMGYLIAPKKWLQVGTYTDSVYFRSGYNTEEYEANEFAAAFLMPRETFLTVANQNREGNTFLIEPIASYFGVSSDAAKTRGKWLNVFSWE